MDCYSEYKYNHYQQQQQQQQHTYYNNPSMRFGTSSEIHHPQQQSSFYDGFSRHNNNNNHQHPPLASPFNHHHHPHHSPLHQPQQHQGAPFSPFDANNESGSQFYYSNMHPSNGAAAAASSYYHNPYESYRNHPPSSYHRGYNYPYHNNLHFQPPPPHHSPQLSPHFQGHYYPPQFNSNTAADHFHHYPTPTPPPQTSSSSTSSSSNTTIPSTRSISQSESSPSSSSSSTNLRSNEFSSKNDAQQQQQSSNSNEKSIENESRHIEDRGGGGGEEKKSIDEKSPANENESEIQQATKSSSSSEEHSNVEGGKHEEKQPINNNDNTSCSSSVEEEQEVAKLKNDSFNENEHCKENHENEDTPATGYSSEASSCRINNKIHRDNEKLSATSSSPSMHIGGSNRSSEQQQQQHSTLNIPIKSSNSNTIQNEYLFGLHQIREHLNVSISLLTKTEQNFAMNITNLLIQYGESWIRLTNELFERDGFIVDIKSLYKFTSNIKARIKFDITRSIKEFSAGKITYLNKKLYQKFLTNLFGILNQYVEKIKSAVESNGELIECWDSYKTIFLEIGFDATNVLSKSSFIEIERLYNSFNDLQQKIHNEIKYTKHVLFYEYPNPLDNRLIINLYPHNNFNDRSLTPIAKLSTLGYNHHYNNNNNMELSHNYPPPKHHHRYPMSPSPWYTHDYYNNWILNPDDRRHFPDSHSFFSSMRNSKKNHHYHPSSTDKQQKAQHDTSSIKRTKRKARVDESTIKKDPGKELIKNLTPLPGFLQTFGQTEIGRFSEAFYISSDSPHYQYNNESDVDSPQPYDFDSLDGPIPKSFYMCGSENDSPMSTFSEIMCKDF